MSDDFLHRFQLENAGVRGTLVRLNQSWGQILENGNYSEPLANLLGQTVAASALFTSTIKFDGRLSIHLRDSGALKLLFADCTHDGLLRGIARWDGAQPQAPIQIDPLARLAITIENASTDTRYQGLVMAEGTHLSQAFEGYFERSEQLPTRIVLATSSGRCGGIMLQKIAGSGGTTPADADGWNRVGHLLATLTPRELLDLAPEPLLLRLFQEEGVRLQPAQPLAFRCTCSRDRVEDMLRSLGRAESDATLAEQGSIEVTCEFCNRRYVFDERDVETVFAPAPASASASPTEPPATRH